MQRRIQIAIDVMGGDNAPKAAIQAVSAVAKNYIDVEFHLFGDSAIIEETLKLYPIEGGQSQCIIHHCSEVIKGNDEPMKALRGLDSSIRRGIDAVKRMEADAFLSAGNTGALMAAAKVVLGCLPGIRRPAIGSIFPNLKGGGVLLDLGANSECTAGDLVDFAFMGVAFAQVVRGIELPTVGLLNIGSEQVKGRKTEKEAYEALKNSSLAANFYGYVEGNDIVEGTTDVVVTDGFIGNIVLKTSEGVARASILLMKKAFGNGILAKLGGLLARKSIKASFKSIDPRLHNGAMFLGINGVVVKSHGSADELGFANALELTINIVRNDINLKITSHMNSLNISTGEVK